MGIWALYKKHKKRQHKIKKSDVLREKKRIFYAESWLTNAYRFGNLGLNALPDLNEWEKDGFLSPELLMSPATCQQERDSIAKSQSFAKLEGEGKTNRLTVFNRIKKL